MLKWFLCKSDEVTGPFSTDDVRSKLSNGEIGTLDLIWGHPQTEWKNLSWWQRELPRLEQTSAKGHDPRQWHYALGGKTTGPVDRKHMIQALNNVENYKDVLLWTKGMTSWAPVFEFHDIMDELGVNRRRFPRADIKGSVIININGQNHIGQLRSISVGGCGLTGVTAMRPGQNITLDLKSEHFYETIRAAAEVRYISETGYVGLKFRNVSMEAQSAIIDYIKSKSVPAARAA